MPRFPFQFFDIFIVRTPCFSFKEFQNCFSEKNKNLKFENTFGNNTFREAVYLAIDIYRNRIQHQTLTANPLKLTIHDEERPGSEPKLVL